jgi:hypothetical protein
MNHQYDRQYDQMVKHVAEGYICGILHPHKVSECAGKISDAKQFKARIEFKAGITFHAIEVWMQADSIIDAGAELLTYFGALGITASDVVKLVEINEK